MNSQYSNQNTADDVSQYCVFWLDGNSWKSNTGLQIGTSLPIAVPHFPATCQTMWSGRAVCRCTFRIGRSRHLLTGLISIRFQVTAGQHRARAGTHTHELCIGEFDGVLISGT